MSDSHRRRVEMIFQKAADLPVEQRPAYLNDQAGDDLELRSEVERLLGRLERGAAASLKAVEELDALETDMIGEQVGPYKLLQLIGEGGFGVVYMAEQQTPVRRKVALKIIKLGMDTKQVIARFEAERQALALMEHPGIAHVFDAGATETGRPYFVMELVAGVPITEYCDENNLSARERLELFIRVCQAVQHAHQKGVIHRDIKPSNVLVTLNDGSATPKVIDFGVAKATSQRLTEKTLFTEFLQFVGTPQYMSPEQAEMCGQDVDTRTDVYSLGVLLYELLTGTTPFDKEMLHRAALSEVQKIIREQEPPTPSRRVSSLGVQLARVARQRDAEPLALSRLIRGDLDWIVMKALEKERGRRYETAAALGEDVARHLNHEPVLAGPPGAAYKFRKFVRRNRVAVLTGSLGIAAVLIGLAVASIGFVRARAEAESSRAINAIFNDMLISVDPMQLRLLSAYAPEAGMTGGGGETANYASLAETVRGATEKVEQAFEGKPELAATARETIGMTLRGLGRYAEAEPQLRAALEIRRRILGEDHRDTLRSALATGDLLFETGRAAEGEPLVRAAYEGMRRAYGAEHPRTLCGGAVLAAVLSDLRRYEEADELFERTLEAQRRVLGGEHRDALATMWKWSVSYLLRANVADGQALARELYDVSQRVLDPDDSLNILSKPLLGWWYVARFEYSEAEAIVRPGLEQSRRILGDEHPFTYMTMQCLARSLQSAGAQEEKEKLYRQALAGLRKTRGEQHWQTLSSTFDLAQRLASRGDFEEAEDLNRLLARTYKKLYGEQSSETMRMMNGLAVFLETVGKLDAAFAIARERLEYMQRRYSAGSWMMQEQLDLYAQMLLRNGRVGEAREVTRGVLETAREQATESEADYMTLNSSAWIMLTCSPPDMRDPVRALPLAKRAVELTEGRSHPVLDTLALAYHLNGDDDRAIETQLLSLALRPPGQGDVITYDANLVRYLLHRGDVAEAERRVQQAADLYRATLGEDNPLLARQLHGSASELASNGHFHLAEAMYRQALDVYRGLFEEPHLQIARVLADLGEVLVERDKYAEGASVCADAFEQYRNLAGEDHLLTAQTAYSLGFILQSGGKVEQAVAVYQDALGRYRRLQADNLPEALWLRRDLAEALVVLGRFDEAEQPARESLDRTSALYGDMHLRTVLAMKTQGMLLVGLGRADEAEPLLRRCVTSCEELPLPEHKLWRRDEFRGALGSCLAALGRYEEAEGLLARSYDALRDDRGEGHVETRELRRRLIELYEAWGKPEQAAMRRAEQ